MGHSKDIQSLGSALRDTLNLISSCEFVYFPFGRLTDKSFISTGLLIFLFDLKI